MAPRRRQGLPFQASFRPRKFQGLGGDRLNRERPVPYPLLGDVRRKGRATASGTYPGLGRTLGQLAEDYPPPRDSGYALLRRGTPKKKTGGTRGTKGTKRKRKRASGKVTCKMQSMTTPSGKKVRRKVCRNSLGQIVSNKKASKKKKRRT